MKVTKFMHACLLVEIDDRRVLFDPGVYSTYDLAALPALDDIVITHSHPDHMDVERIQALRGRFPEVRIVAPEDARAMLEHAGIDKVMTTPPEGIQFFHSPHEPIRPMIDVDPPEENGAHLLDVFSHPGDSHSFTETKAILALPVSGPWGSTVDAVRVALSVKPTYVIPIHDWHWHDAAREQVYKRLETMFAGHGITFLPVKDGEPVTVTLP